MAGGSTSARHESADPEEKDGGGVGGGGGAQEAPPAAGKRRKGAAARAQGLGLFGQLELGRGLGSGRLLPRGWRWGRGGGPAPGAFGLGLAGRLEGLERLERRRRTEPAGSEPVHHRAREVRQESDHLRVERFLFPLGAVRINESRDLLPHHHRDDDRIRDVPCVQGAGQDVVAAETGGRSLEHAPQRVIAARDGDFPDRLVVAAAIGKPDRFPGFERRPARNEQDGSRAVAAAKIQEPAQDLDLVVPSVERPDILERDLSGGGRGERGGSRRLLRGGARSSAGTMPVKS